MQPLLSKLEIFKKLLNFKFMETPKFIFTVFENPNFKFKFIDIKF